MDFSSKFDLSTHNFPVTELVISGKTIRAKVDTADLPKILSAATRWFAGYSQDSRTFYVKAKRQHLCLHRVITDCPSGLQVDHVNHDGLDNRRCNLRVVTQAQNSANTRHKLGSAGFRNVNRVRNGQFRASVVINYKRHIIGYFPTPEEAGIAAREFRQRAGLL